MPMVKRHEQKQAADTAAHAKVAADEGQKTAADAAAFAKFDAEGAARYRADDEATTAAVAQAGIAGRSTMQCGRC